MADFSYNSDLNGGSLMVRESRVVADLLLNNATASEWHQAIQIDNLLQKRSPATAKRNAQAIRKRLELIAPEFWRALRDGDDQLATQVAFYAALERNLLLVEFIESVVRDAYITQANQLASYQWLEFLEDRTHKDESISTWQDATKKKMGQVVFRMLIEAGYMQNNRNLQLQKVLLRPEMKVMLEDSYKQRIIDCMEVSLRTG
ncbi:hypothetical protein O59_002492 [Cellvibrio sp. BR]|uniref:DUF1819 family protein n=1 Tax=Cellvibrio sp. BR TaxID=1134474 RepID=UPI00026012F0|nr:DUF1819 family protein [Cellvibrio sp. BR]EIK44769.1 hypothetical protein O59_002492 [Cellvibrio sp. BR]